MKCENEIDKKESAIKEVLKNPLQWGKKHEEMIDKLSDRLAKMVDDKLGNTPLKHFFIPEDIKKVSDMINAYRVDLAKLNKNAVKLSEFLSENLTEDESIALTRALAGDGEIPEHLRSVYDRFRRIIDRNADNLVRAGVLDEKYKIKDYLKRYYKDYLEDKHKFSIKMQKLFKRKDLTHEERLELGLIENADFVVANTILEQNKQLYKAKLLKQIADVFAVDEAKEGYVRVSDESVGGGIKKYGALAGKYVPNELMESLKQAYLVDSLYNTIWTRLVDHIKVNVTVKFIGTHLYNVLSNLQLAFVNGDLGSLVHVIGMAATNREKFNKLVNLAKEFGLNNELDEFTNFSKSLNPKTKKDPISLVIAFFKNAYLAEGTMAGTAVRKVYSMEDEIFKLAGFYKRIKGRKVSKATARKAFNEAMADYVDYSTPLPGIVKFVDKNGLFPFTHYIWKSTPRVAKIIFKNPLKFTLLQIALLESGANLFNENDNYQKPSWAADTWLFGLKYFPSNLFAAKQWVNIGDDKFFNIGRSLPGFRYTDLTMNLGFVGAISNIISGKDPLWGSKIYYESDSTPQRYSKIAQKLAEYYLPPFSGGRYTQRAIKLATDYKHPKNAYGKPLTWEEFWLRIVGIREFDREEELLKHYKATVKAWYNGNISKEEMQQEHKKIIEFAKKRKLKLDFKKAIKYKNKHKKQRDNAAINRWVN